jgi:putative tryptophan/tyrosine transport system substrate-binding protein
MKRRKFIGLLGVSVVAWASSARAQQPNKIPRLVYLDGRSHNATAEGLLSGLRDLGYVDGRNIILIKQQFAAPSVKGMREAILEGLPNADILVVSGTVGGVAAKSVSPNIPVVFISVGAPVDIGLVDSLAHPGGNMTGTTFEATSETYAKRLQILKEIMPGLSRVAVLGAKDDPNFPFAMVSLKQSAPELSVSLSQIEMDSTADLDGVFNAIKQNGAEALIVVAGSLTYGLIQRTADLALAQGLPSCHGFKEAVAAGGLVSLGPDLIALARQSARMVDKIIRGEHAADIPVEQPAQYVVSVNLKTAKTLGLTIPPALLARADEVIE